MKKCYREFSENFLGPFQKMPSTCRDTKRPPSGLLQSRASTQAHPGLSQLFWNEVLMISRSHCVTRDRVTRSAEEPVRIKN